MSRKAQALVILVGSFAAAAVATWWALDVQHMTPAHVAIYSLAAIGALDLAEYARDLIRKLWQQRRP